MEGVFVVERIYEYRERVSSDFQGLIGFDDTHLLGQLWKSSIHHLVFETGPLVEALAGDVGPTDR